MNLIWHESICKLVDELIEMINHHLSTGELSIGVAIIPLAKKFLQVLLIGKNEGWGKSAYSEIALLSSEFEGYTHSENAKGAWQYYSIVSNLDLILADLVFYEVSEDIAEQISYIREEMTFWS